MENKEDPLFRKKNPEKGVLHRPHSQSQYPEEPRGSNEKVKVNTKSVPKQIASKRAIMLQIATCEFLIPYDSKKTVMTYKDKLVQKVKKIKKWRQKKNFKSVMKCNQDYYSKQRT